MGGDDELLEQYDFATDEYLYKVIDKYSSLIGLFFIRFSELEHTLNLGIAEAIHDRTHQIGYIVIENLTMTNKINIFYKFYLGLVSALERDDAKKELTRLKTQLAELNTFRNKLAHANWLTLSNKGMVRTKIIINDQDGQVLFKRVEILPKNIKFKIKETEKLTISLENFVEESHQM